MQDDGTTPVYIAAQEGHERTLEILLQAKADANITLVGSVGSTAFDLFIHLFVYSFLGEGGKAPMLNHKPPCTRKCSQTELLRLRLPSKMVTSVP